MLNNSSTAPWVLQFSLLKKITDGFSEKRKVGSGGYGEVYMGKLDNGEEIAVKKLYPQPGLGDKQFMNEFSNLIKVQHENIVRLVGYCYDEQDEFVQHNGKLVLAQRVYRMLCFEYLHGGSLDKHLYEEHCGLDWHTRYKIIKGICEGLNYLHGLKESILHLDLKPANILLDKNMVPKIADFGLSRLFGETRTHITKNCIGTRKYMPPEFIIECKITKKHDVFSLGVIIIEIMTGREGYSKYHETSLTSEQFIELVHNKWKVRIEATSIHTSPEEDCKQVKRCIEIALNCVKAERHKRPTIGDIVHKLKETETMRHEVSMSFSQEPGSVSSHFKREMVQNGKEVSPGLETMEEKRGRQVGVEDDEKAGFSKIGPWGGNAGRAHDIKVSSYRLESVTIWCADIVDALAFSYSDLNGKMHTVGPWGGPGGSPRTIKVGPSEFLTEVSGTTGPYILAAADVVRSLMLVTNAGSYGPFGQGGGTAFRTSVQSNDSIVGFFGRAEQFVHAIGVYVKPNLPTLAASRHFEREMDQMVRDEKVDSELETIQGERGKEDDDVLSEIQLSPRPEPGRRMSKVGLVQQEMHNTMDLAFHLLETITNGFSEEKKVSHGGYGDVYRAVHKGEEIAVKRFHLLQDLDDKEFDNEFHNLNNVKHQNIVRLVGYCYESRDTYVEHKGQLMRTNETERVLCFEYVKGGSLEQHIIDESCELDWPTCYKIIRGICEGLNYLHNGQEKPIYHLDIKPGNILLDENMTPKIAEFGLSILLDTTKTFRTDNIKGTRGYMPPEYIANGCISKKFDVFSLGVLIIKIMAGNMGYFSCSEKPPQQFIEHVIGNWRPRLQGTSGYSSHEADILQVKSCVEIALRCVEEDRHKRPTIREVVDELDKLEVEIKKMPVLSNQSKDRIGQISSVSKLVDVMASMAVSEAPIQLPLSEPGLSNWYYRRADKAGKLLRISAPKGQGGTTEVSPASSETETTKLLGVHPLELRFPFEPNKCIPCQLSLTNKTDYFVVFWVMSSCPDRYRNKAGTLLLRSTQVITVIMEGQQQPPPGTDNFTVVMVTLSSEGDMLSLSSIGSEINSEDDFFNRIEGLGGEAYVAMLTAVVCDPASETMPHENISTQEYGDLKSIDVHPTEPWILTSHDNGHVYIWNYQTHTQGKVMMAVRVTKKAGLDFKSSAYSAKFIAREGWFVAGDDNGYIHVFGIKKFEAHLLKKFEAHRDSRVYSLVVHPTRPKLLSSSVDHLIKLWEWGNGWVCTRTFEGHTSPVHQVTFNPKDTDTFASAAGSDVKVWTIDSSNPKTTFDGRHSVGYYFADSDPQYMITSSGSRSAYIWDLQRAIRVHTLNEESGEYNKYVNVVACHPELPILVTGSSYGTVCLWNATTYRLEKMVRFMLGKVEDLRFINTKDMRLVVGCRGGIAIMEINLPTLVDQQ